MLSLDTLENQVNPLRSGDVETNLDRKKSSVIRFCHWNLNGLATHFPKGLLNRGFYYHSQLWYNLCLGNVFRFFFLDSFLVSQYDENIMIKGYSFLIADHPSNSEGGGVC